MNIKDAIVALEDKKNILKDSQGNHYQRVNDSMIMVTFDREDSEHNSSCLASSTEDKKFLEKNLYNSFELVEQWYRGDIKYPILCFVRETGWTNPKIVCINSFSGTMFITGYGESYIPTYHTRITPLTDDDIDSLKRGMTCQE